MSSRREVASFLVSRTSGCAEYSELVGRSTIRVIKEQDFGAKEDVIRIVDYENRALPQYDDLPAHTQQPSTIPIC